MVEFTEPWSVGTSGAGLFIQISVGGAFGGQRTRLLPDEMRVRAPLAKAGTGISEVRRVRAKE
jgi:hypothetical protein